MIEFDVDEPDDDGVDEDLPQPRERHRPGSSRLRRLLGIVAAVLAVGGLVTYAQLSGRESHRQTAATPSASTPAPPSGTSADGGLLIEHLGDRNGTQRNDVEVTLPARLVAPACPQSTDGFASCVVTTTVSDALVAAVHKHFPHARTSSVSTATLRATDAGSRPGLWSRLYRAKLSRGATLTVLVTRDESDVDVVPIVLALGDTTVAYARHIDGRYRVEVQVRAPAARPPSVAGLSGLAADARLLRS